MSEPACTSCQDVLSCGDSPLSITGNVIGILTFATALLISIQVYVNSMRNADRSILELTETFRSRVDEIRYLDDKLQRRRTGLKEELAQRVGNAMRQAEVPFQEAGALLHKLDTDRYDGGRRLWAQAQFVLREDLLKQGLQNTENAMGTLREVANEAFESISGPTEQEIAFRNGILQQLSEMRTDIVNFMATTAKLLSEVRDRLPETTGDRSLELAESTDL